MSEESQIKLSDDLLSQIKDGNVKLKHSSGMYASFDAGAIDSLDSMSLTDSMDLMDSKCNETN